MRCGCRLSIPSPMADFGYDVADYCDIDPLFGTLADFDALLAEAHARGLKVILDLVPNHTSDQHPWFLESRASRTQPKRDWYIWRDPAPGGGPPNNWLSRVRRRRLGVRRGHAASTTPRLPHRAARPQLAQPGSARGHARGRALLAERGVDGFRVDAIRHLIKDEQFRDNPPNPAYRAGRAAGSRASCRSTRPTGRKSTTSSPDCAA